MAKVLKVRNADNTGWDEIASSIPDVSTYLTINSASVTYATKEELENVSVDLTGYATESYVNSASSSIITSIVDVAPETLNTLNELAAALNDDENFATTVTNSIAEKQKYIPYSASISFVPETGDLWVDSSTNPPALKTYNGSSWVQLGSAVDDAQAIIAASMFMG